MSCVCEVLSCNSTYEPGRTYHRFPIDPTRRKGWLKILGIKAKDLKTVSAVCSRHFRSKDYEYNKRLFPDAVPCLRLNIVTKKVQSSKNKHGKETSKHLKVNMASKPTFKKQNSKLSTKMKKSSKYMKLESHTNNENHSCIDSKSSRKDFVEHGVNNLSKITKSSTSQGQLEEGELNITSEEHFHKSFPKEVMLTSTIENISQSKLNTRRSLQLNRFHAGTKENKSTGCMYELTPINRSQLSKYKYCCTEDVVETSTPFDSSESSQNPRKRTLENSYTESVKKRKPTKQNILTHSKSSKSTSQRNNSVARLRITGQESLSNSSLSCSLIHIEKTIAEMQNRIRQLEQKSILDEKKIETFKNALIEQRRNDIKTLMDEKENELLLRMDLLYMDYDPKRICRLCLVLVDKKESLTSLDSHPKNQALISLIRNATNIQIELEDGLPSGICSECLHQIKRIDWIQRKTHKSNALIKKFVMMRKNLNESCSTGSSSVNTLGTEKLLLSDNLFDEIEEEEGTDVFKIEDVFSLESSTETIPFDETTIKQEVVSDEEETKEIFVSHLSSDEPVVKHRRERRCKQCQTEFTNSWTWSKHFKYCNRTLQCSECNKRFWNARLFRNHKVRRQSCVCAESLRYCYDCQIVFRWKWELVFHVFQHEVEPCDM
uniref:Uncharacterized protein n=1 Tax=Cuerna arida TaxID=1464854 RepID=A0A1B6EK38_9HEMI